MKLGWLPLSGYVSPGENFGQYIYYGVMPILILSFSLLASVARQTRSNMLEVVNQDYIRTARANGLAEKSVIYKHALKNALIPVITTIGLQVRVRSRRFPDGRAGVQYCWYWYFNCKCD